MVFGIFLKFCLINSIIGENMGFSSFPLGISPLVFDNGLPYRLSGNTSLE